MRVIVKEIIAVAIGGGLGSVCRFGLSRWVNFTFRHQDFPWGIWACNVLGSFAIGILAGLLIYHYDVWPFWCASLIISLFGGFTI